MNHIGPKSSNRDNLVFFYDIGDTANSYKGEPTVNHIMENPAWWGDGSNQSIGSKGYVPITDESLKYKGFPTYLWTPGVSCNCYLQTPNAININELSTIWTVSCYIKRDDAGPISSGITGSYIYNMGTNTAAASVYDIGDGWYRVVRTVTGPENYVSLLGFYGLFPDHRFYLSGVQLEKNIHPTSYAFPSVPRTTTECLLDLTGNEILNMNDIHFDENSQFYFNGSDGRITIPEPTINFAPNKFTIELILHPVGDINSRFLTPSSNGIDQFISYIAGTDQRVAFGIAEASDVNNRSFYSSIGSVPLGANTHIVAQIDNLDVRLFVNGILEHSSTESHPIGDWNSYWALGQRGNNTHHFDGYIPIFKIYDEILTHAEILQNYNLYKTRFNLP